MKILIAEDDLTSRTILGAIVRAEVCETKTTVYATRADSHSSTRRKALRARP